MNIVEFVDVWDFLLIRFFLDIGICFGLLNNLILEEFLVGKVKDGCKVMLVVKYKWVKVGSVICLMLLELYKFMNIYVW